MGVESVTMKPAIDAITESGLYSEYTPQFLGVLFFLPERRPLVLVLQMLKDCKSWEG